MPPRPPRHRRFHFRPEPWLAALVVVGMMVSGQSAGAAAMSAASLVEDDHGAFCGCGSRCREAACCCGPTESEPTKPWEAFEPSEEAAAASRPVEKDSGPCLGAAPCGDPAAPLGSSVIVVGKSAALGFEPGEIASQSNRLHLNPPTVQPPDPRSARLERPPETDVSA